jgi:hypothetical protein
MGEVVRVRRGLRRFRGRGNCNAGPALPPGQEQPWTRSSDALPKSLPDVVEPEPGGVHLAVRRVRVPRVRHARL